MSLVDAISMGVGLPLDVTILLFCIRLSQLTSRMIARMANLRQDSSLHTHPYLTVCRICAALNSMLQELDAWYDSAPTVTYYSKLSL